MQGTLPMNDINEIIKGLEHVELNDRSLLKLIGDDQYLEHRPIEEEIENSNDNWVCYEGVYWFLEFVNDHFVYLAVPISGLLPIRIHSKFIVKKPKSLEFDMNTFLLIGNRSLFKKPKLLPNRFSPIINELLK